MCLYISEFGVTDNDEKDTFVVKHPYKINFYRTTRVKKCDDFSGPVYGFNFKPFTDLLQEKKDSTFAYDLIGDITSCGTIETQEEKRGKLKRFIRIEMQDTMGNKLQNVTLWGAYADQLDEYMGDRSALGHVLIIQFAKHKIYRGGITLKMYSSMLLKNLGGEASDHQIVPLVKYDRYDVRQDFLLQKVNLADIRDIADIKSDVVVATIKVIERDNKWYYLPCGSCNRIVDEKTVDKKDSDSGELKKQVVLVCSNKECGEVTNVCYNYKIQIRVLDKSGSVSLTLFDRVASKLLNRTAEEFIREMRKSTEEQLPSNSKQPLSSFLSPPTMGKLKGALSGPEES
ncbi:nucleic acid-binding, OB-fold, replication protein A, OB domain protein [Tanacetum coccineum]